MKNLAVIILAAGKGTRMNQGRPSSIPKALYPIGGKPMVSYIIDTLEKIHMDKPILVIGYKAQEVKKEFGNRCEYVVQKKRLGTGHAAKLAIDSICVSPRPASALVRDVLILQADDSAFYKTKTLEKFIKNHQDKKATLSFLTTHIPKMKDIGRVIRDEKNQVVDIVENENLTSKQKKIDEINCGCYLADAAWIKKNIKKIKRTYKGGKEYPLTDIIKIALAQKEKVIAYQIPRREWHGINTLEQLKKAEKIIS